MKIEGSNARLIKCGGIKMSQGLEYDIKEKYSHELNEINAKLNQIKDGRINGIKGSNMDGDLSTNVMQLRTMIAKLLLKIQNGADGTDEEIAKWFTK